MKKNTMMRVASALLVAVLLTTCAISGTFAKYIAADDGSDSARVAKWGVVVEAKDFDMFKTDYETADAGVFSGNTVVSGKDPKDDVLAPGTSGSFGNIKITGTPEVAVQVDIVATVGLTGDWKDANGDFYCPVVVTVGTTAFNGLDYESAADFAAAIKANIDGKSNKYAPNTNLATTYDNTNLDLAWAWAIEGTTGSKNNQSNAADTFLGDYAANSGDLTISIGVKIDVTQID